MIVANNQEQTPGKIVKQLREQHSWTMAELARHAGISESYVSRFERDMIRNASAVLVKGLARALNVTTDYIMGVEALPQSNVTVDPELVVYMSNLGELGEHDRNIIKGIIRSMLEERRRG